MIELKTSEELKRMREAGRLCALCMEELINVVRPGITTKDLDRIAYDFTKSHEATPSFLNYEGFPASICASVNDEVVHGIPSKQRVLHEGDIVSIDMGVKFHGYHSDMARTVPVGNISKEAKKLINVTKDSFFAGMNQAVIGNHICDVSKSVQMVVEKAGFSVVRDLVGHGVGRNLHEEPDVPNFYTGRKGPLLRNGMVIAIEPMVNYGNYQVAVLDNDWTVVSDDESLSAHYENTVAITERGPVILTEI